MSCISLFSATLITTGLAITASAQWTATVLEIDHDNDHIWLASGPNQFGGRFRFLEGEFHAGVRSFNDDHWIDLHPRGPYSSSEVWALDGANEGGGVIGSDGHVHAALWSGSPESFVDLHPADITDSAVHGISGGRQCGQVWNTNLPGSGRAAMWSGSPETYVDLQPSQGMSSYASAIWHEQQVGYVRVPYLQGYVDHAALWFGSAESCTDLNPGPYQSAALGVADGIQVGYVRSFDQGMSHASMWSGSPESWVDLHSHRWPWGSQSQAIAVAGDFQCGTVESACETPLRATLWHGTAESVVNLHRYLPESANFLTSEALAMWSDGEAIHVFGRAQRLDTGELCAILWSTSLPICAGDYNNDGFVNGDDYDGFASDFEGGNEAADLNWDCFVNGDDFDEFADAFELGC